MNKTNMGFIVVMMLLLIGCSAKDVFVEPVAAPIITSTVSSVGVVSPLLFTSPVATTENVQSLSPAIPNSGKTSIMGQVISSITGKPTSNIVVRLAKVYRQNGQGAYVLDGAFSPGAYTNDYGFFVIENIDPEEYVIVVGDVNAKYVIIEDNEGKARVWDLKPDQIFDAQILNVMLSN